MAIISASDWAAYTGITVTGADATSIGLLCAAIDAGIKRILGQKIEAQTHTDVILDAPSQTEPLVLPARPVNAVTSIKLNWQGRGVVANFADTTALVAGEDYQLVIDDKVNSISRSGIVRYLRGPSWAYWRQRPHFSLATRLVTAPGAILVSFTSGFATVPLDLVAAAAEAVTMVYQRREEGVPLTSESWNGRSLSRAGEFLAASVLNTPHIAQVLRQYGASVFVA